jgi:CheY-like chemotaxis protein
MSTQLRILVVDDCRDTLLVLERLVSKFNCTVCTCNDSELAVQTALEFGPHVIFLDIAMPKLDGYEVAEDLRYHRLADYMLVALTSHADAAHRRECAISGFDLFLAKPISIEHVKTVIDKASTRFSMQI